MDPEDASVFYDWYANHFWNCSFSRTHNIYLAYTSVHVCHKWCRHNLLRIYRTAADGVAMNWNVSSARETASTSCKSRWKVKLFTNVHLSSSNLADRGPTISKRPTDDWASCKLLHDWHSYRKIFLPGPRGLSTCGNCACAKIFEPLRTSFEFPQNIQKKANLTWPKLLKICLNTKMFVLYLRCMVKLQAFKDVYSNVESLASWHITLGDTAYTQ